MSANQNGDEKKSLLGKNVTSEERWKLIGFICAIVATILLSLGTASSQALGNVIPICQLMAFRYATLLIISASACWLFRLDVRSVWDKKIIFYVVAYILLDQGQLTTLLLAPNYVSLTTSACLKETAGVLLGFLATFWFDRVCDISQALSMSFCIIGIVLVTQPGVLFGSLSSPEGVSHSICGNAYYKQNAVYEFNTTLGNFSIFNSSTTPNSTSNSIDWNDSVYLGYLFSCIAPIMYITMFFVGNKNLHDTNAAVLMFWDSLVGCVAMSCTMAVFEEPSFPSGLNCISLFFGHLVSLSSAHLVATFAILNLPPFIMATVLPLQLVVGLCFQYTVLKHINPGHGDVLEVIGAVVVMLGGLAGPFYQMFKLRQKVAEREREVISETEVKSGGT